MSLALANRVKKLEAYYYADTDIKPDVSANDDNSFVQLKNVYFNDATGKFEPMRYVAPPTGNLFHDDRSFVKLIIGPSAITV